MAEYTALAPLFTDIANAIRSKTGETGAITANTFPEKINEIESFDLSSFNKITKQRRVIEDNVTIYKYNSYSFILLFASLIQNKVPTPEDWFSYYFILDKNERQKEVSFTYQPSSTLTYPAILRAQLDIDYDGNTNVNCIATYVKGTLVNNISTIWTCVLF